MIKFCNGSDDMISHDTISATKRGPGVTVEEVATRLKHLIGMAQVNNTSLMVRAVLKAIDPDIDLCMEREGLPKTFDAVVTRAATIDQVNRKCDVYSDMTSLTTQFYSSPSINNAASTQETIDELVRRAQELSTLVGSLKTSKDLNSKAKKVLVQITCYGCGETGHLKTDCPNSNSKSEQGQSGNGLECQ